MTAPKLTADELEEVDLGLSGVHDNAYVVRAKFGRELIAEILKLRAELAALREVDRLVRSVTCEDDVADSLRGHTQGMALLNALRRVTT